MRWRKRIWLILLVAPVVLGPVVAYVEAARRAAALANFGHSPAVAECDITVERTPSEADILAELEDPVRLQTLFDSVRQHSADITRNNREFVHNETTIMTELDASGQELSKRQVVERVWFDGEVEHRIVLHAVDMLTGREQTRVEGAARRSPPSTAIFPLSAREKSGDYRYQVVGFCSLEGRRCLAIEFEAEPPLHDKFSGRILLDGKRFDWVRFEGRWAQPPRFVDRMDLIVDFGVVESGTIQAVCARVSGTGGFAWIHRRYESETICSEYRPRDSQNETKASPQAVSE